MADVQISYQHLRELYSAGDSIVTFPLSGELREDERRAILAEIEEAYERLMEFFTAESRGEPAQQTLPEVAVDLRGEIAAVESFTGGALAWIRERLGLDLEAVSRATKINKQYLANIEEERFSTLPPAVYVRGYVAAYARYLSLDDKKVVADYMARYDAARGA
ncbi:MAG: hypothetical protein Kow0025_10200 [Thermodesulfovibrionales bacterium]